MRARISRITAQADSARPPPAPLILRQGALALQEMQNIIFAKPLSEMRGATS